MPRSKEDRMETIFNRMMGIAEEAEAKDAVGAASACVAIMTGNATIQVLTQQGEEMAAQAVRDAERDQERGTLVAGRHDESVRECQEMLREASDKVVRLRVKLSDALRTRRVWMSTCKSEKLVLR